MKSNKVLCVILGSMVQCCKYLGFVFHATKGLHCGTEALMAVARKALFAMRRCCALLGIRGPALQCKLFDTLVLPILSYGCEVLGVDAKHGAAAEALQKGLMKSLLGVRKPVATHMVLAEFCHFLLQFHFWLRILHHHHRQCTSCQLAMDDGFAIGQSAVKASWQHFLGDFLHSHTKSYRGVATF